MGRIDTFYVVENLSDAKSFKAPCFILEENLWDDYGLKSTFHLYYKSQLTTDLVSFGSVKFLKKDHESGQVKLPEKFTNLNDQYCSVGTSLDYYETFKINFGADSARSILQSMRDCAISTKIRARFRNHPGYESSLMRSGQDEEMFKEIENILKGRQKERDFSFVFATQIAEWSEHIIDFDFEFNRIFPYRMNVIVGKNGTGKTTFLANLARVYVGLDRDAVGYFLGDRPLFRQVIAVSYNPFDDFYIPNSRGKDREITKNNEGFFFGYKYLGIRKRLSSDLYSLKTLPDLDKEFRRALDLISSKDDLDEFWSILDPILKDSSFGLRSSQRDVSLLKVDFRRLSSGQKFVLLAIIRLYLNTKEHSLILIDEPENHLHPTIIMRFVQAINLLLEVKNSFAIVSTHSPVILQETPSRYITRLDRVFDEPQISKLSTESFGGSFNEIAESVFKLSVEDSSFDKTMMQVHESGIAMDDVRILMQAEPNLRIKGYIRGKNERD